MHETMARHVESGRMPGLVTLVSRHGETHVDAIGVKAFGGKEPMRPTTIFRIASITKPITAAAAMILSRKRSCGWTIRSTVVARAREPQGPQAHRQSLDDTVPAKRAITLRDLLTFRLGIAR